MRCVPRPGAGRNTSDSRAGRGRRRGVFANGKRLAYVRGNDPEIGKYQLVTANADGSDEKVLRIAPTPIPDWISWSPDGNLIAYVVNRGYDAQGEVRTYNIASGDDRPLKSFSDKGSTGVAWTPNGRGMLINCEDRSTGFSRPQIGYVSYPAGESHTITNDANGYSALHLSADGKSMVAIQRQQSDSLVMLPSTGKNQTPIPFAGIPNQSRIGGFDWDRRGNLIIAFRTSIVRFSPDGIQQTTLMSDPSAAIHSATYCSKDGPIFVSWFNKAGNGSQNIWRLDADGTHPTQLTNGKNDAIPRCSPDRKWVYYSDSNKLVIMRVPLDGGVAEVVPGSLVANGFVNGVGMNFSADGKWLASVATVTNMTTQEASHPIALIDVDSKSQSSTRFLTAHKRLLPRRIHARWERGGLQDHRKRSGQHLGAAARRLPWAPVNSLHHRSEPVLQVVAGRKDSWRRSDSHRI